MYILVSVYLVSYYCYPLNQSDFITTNTGFIWRKYSLAFIFYTVLSTSFEIRLGYIIIDVITYVYQYPYWSFVSRLFSITWYFEFCWWFPVFGVIGLFSNWNTGTYLNSIHIWEWIWFPYCAVQNENHTLCCRASETTNKYMWTKSIFDTSKVMIGLCNKHFPF